MRDSIFFYSRLEEKAMTIQECYQHLGGDYAKMEQRLSSVRLIEKFIAKFLDDGSYAALRTAMEEGDRLSAFRAAHTLKGVCGNLCFDRLLISVTQLTEHLRPECEAIPAQAAALWPQVQQDYAQTALAIHDYLNAVQQHGTTAPHTSSACDADPVSQTEEG